jgi:ABC-type glycerol-3-phosphate transport system substrate-binding protein
MRALFALIAAGTLVAACSGSGGSDTAEPVVEGDPVTCTTQFTKAGAVEVCE